MSSECSVGAAVAMGLLLEPLAHPKPGAVTRCSRHPDKDIVSYAKSLYPALRACEASCRGDCRGFMARGFKAYRSLISRVAGTNLNLGSLLLLLPVCRASREEGVVGLLLKRASEEVVACDSRESGVEYYRLLEGLGVSHLGRYEGPLPSVGSGEYPTGLVPVLHHTRWDHVHREVLEGYPLTRTALKIILNGGVGEESIIEAVLILLAEYGDTLIGRKYGWRAYKRAMHEARVALSIAQHSGLHLAVSWLDKLWRSRGWNPGSVLDIVALASGLAYAVELGVLVEG